MSGTATPAWHTMVDVVGPGGWAQRVGGHHELPLAASSPSLGSRSSADAGPAGRRRDTSVGLDEERRSTLVRVGVLGPAERPPEAI